MKTHVLIATVPKRKRACSKLLADLTKQTLCPAIVELVADGYGEASLPPCPADLQVRAWITSKLSGPGARWRILELARAGVPALEPGDTVIAIDDDVAIGKVPSLLADLAAAVIPGKQAAAAWGTMVSGGSAGWGAKVNQPLICGVASALAFAAGDLEGLGGLRDELQPKLGYDLLGDMGDDEALVSALLWKHGVAIKHVSVKGLALAPGTQEDCQMLKRRKRDKTWDKQRVALRGAMGWPWPSAMKL